MNLRELIERISAEIIKAAADGDHERAGKLAELESRVVAQISRDTRAGRATDAIAVPPPRGGQLARIARHISTKALSAELAAERGDRQAATPSCRRLALRFAE